MECSATVISHDLYLYVLSVWVDKCIKWRSVPYLRCELLGCTGSCKSCVKCSSCCNENGCDVICNAPKKVDVQNILNFLLPVLLGGLELSVRKTKSKSKKEKLFSEIKQVNDFLTELKKTNNTMYCQCQKTPRMLFFDTDTPYFELFRKLPYTVYENSFCRKSSLIQTYSQAKESIIYLVEYLWTAFFIDNDSSSVKKCLGNALEQVKTGGKKEKLLFINALIGNPDESYGHPDFSVYKNLYDLTRSIFVFNTELAQKELQQVGDSLDAYLEYHKLQQGNSDSNPNQTDFSSI